MAVWSIIKKSELEGALRLDAEYYQPKYRKQASILNEKGATCLADLLEDIRYGIYTEPEYLKEGVNFIRALNLQEYSIDGEILKVRPEVIPSKKYILEEGDVLIVRSGANVGNAGIVHKKHVGATFGSYTIKLKFNRKINPYFAYVFLKTRFGRFQTVQFRTGLAQPNINMPNLKLVKFTAGIPDSTQKTVEEVVKRSFSQVEESEHLYRQAEELLLKELGLDRLSFSQPKYYTVKLSKARESHRLDAEHFQPKYDKLIRHLIKTTKTKLLGEIASYNKRGLQPTYVENGEIIVVNSQHLGRYLLNIEATERTDESFWETNSRSRLKRGDILFYSTGAYIGRTNVYLEDHKAVASNHVNIIRTKDNTNSIYLSVFLNALPGLLQAEQWARGSGQREIYPEDIAHFIVPILPQSFQEKVADLVIKSHQARQKAKALLEEAKQKVEAMIEGKK